MCFDKEDSAGFADPMADALFIVKVIAAAVVAVYVIVPIINPVAWAAL